MPHPSRYWWTLAVLAALVWTGLTPPAARAQARTIDYRGWTVQLTQDLPKERQNMTKCWMDMGWMGCIHALEQVIKGN